MRKKILGAGIASAVTAILVVVAPAQASPAPQQAPTTTQAANSQAANARPDKVKGKHAKRLCAKTKRATRASCYAEILVNDANNLAPATPHRPSPP